jgi:hypothetical protein
VTRSRMHPLPRVACRPPVAGAVCAGVSMVLTAWPATASASIITSTLTRGAARHPRQLHGHGIYP